MFIEYTCNLTLESFWYSKYDASNAKLIVDALTKLDLLSKVVFLVPFISENKFSLNISDDAYNKLKS